MRNLNELGVNPLSRSGPLRSPTDEEIHAFEQHFRVCLPADYRAFLRAFNGGRPTADCFVTKSGHESCIGTFHYLLPEDPLRLDPVHHPDGWEFGNIWAETRELRRTIQQVMRECPAVREISTDQVIPFALDNGNSSMFGFDVRRDPAPVCQIAVSDGFRIVPLTDSFAELIDLLREDQRPRRPKRVRRPTIQLLPKTQGGEFPYHAALALIRELPDVVVQPADVAPPPSGVLELPGGRKARLPQDIVQSLEEMASGLQCFNFSWDGPPTVRGALFKDMVFMKVVDDQVGTLALAKSWGDKLGLSVVMD